MFNEKSILGMVLKNRKGPELLLKYHVPCLGCHFASQELDSLTLQDISNAYGVDLKGLLKDLNNNKPKKEDKIIKKKMTKKMVSKTKANKK